MSRVDRIWRAVVVLTSAGVAVAATSGVAHAAPDTGVVRGLLVATVAGVSLVGTAWGVRHGLTAAGVPADTPFLPAGTPEWGQRLVRSRAAGAVTTLVLGLLLGLVGAGMDVSDDSDRLAGDRLVEFRNGSSTRDASSGGSPDGDGSTTAGGSAVLGSGESGGSGVPTVDTDGDGVPDAPAKRSDGKTSGGGGGGSDDDDDDDGDDPSHPDPDSPVDFVCEALDQYDGDVEDLLAYLGIDEDEVTDAACDTIEDAIEDVEDLLGGVLPSVPTTVPDLPVPTTVPDLPVPTTVTVPDLPVPTTVTVPTLPKLGF